ncbi:MAG: ABC transporter ATP-binding protein [Nocardioidaceae bacterium]
MKTLPRADPGVPDLRSPRRYLLWTVTVQKGAVAMAMLTGVVWMVAQSVMPAIIGKAIDEGVSAQNSSRLLFWATMLLVAGVVQAAAGVIRHRFSVSLWLEASFRTIQLVNRKASELGATLAKRVATGEVVSVGANDIAQLGNAVDVIGRGTGALASFLVVGAILLSASLTLGLVVLIGLPLLLIAIGPLLKPLQSRTMRQREMQGELNSLASDIVGGLRVLRGIGGEQVFHRRYAAESQRVRAAGVQVGRLQSVLDALQILLPGIFVVFVVWLGARFAVDGKISPGQLVAFYGYASFLVLPLRTATEFANKLIRAQVAAARVVHILTLEPEMGDPANPAAEPAGNQLEDADSRVVAVEGAFTALVSDRPEETVAIADRLGRFAPGHVTLGGVLLSDLPRGVVRRRVVVQDTAATLFSGELRDELTLGRGRSDAAVMSAIHTASAEDILDSLPERLDATVDERGRSLSGGQRQRLQLARGLLADPDVLVLVEPTSAVDAHTEARIAQRLRAARSGRTTVVATASPLLLDHADRVVFVAEGQVVAEGTHRELLATEPAYRRTVTRGEDDQ